MHTLSIIGKRTITTTTSVLLKIVIYLRSNFSIANIIQKYNKFSTNIIYYNKLPNSSRAKLVGRHYVLGDFLPNTLTMQIIYVYTYTHTHTYIWYIYIYIYIYIIYIYISIVLYIYMYIYISIYLYIYIYHIYTAVCGGVFSAGVYSGWSWTWQEMRPELFQKHCAVCDDVLVCFQLSRSLALLIFTFFNPLLF